MEDQHIYFCLISCRSTVLAESETSNAAFMTVAKDLLPRMALTTEKRVYEAQGVAFSSISGLDGICTICVTSVDAPLAPRFMFLQELKMSFLGTYADAIQYETLRNKCFQDRFLPVMLNLMTKYSDGVFDPTEQLKEELNRVETMMIDNLDKLLKRGEKLSLLKERTQSLVDETTTLKTGATKVKWNMKSKHIRLLLGVTAIIVIGILISAGVVLLFVEIG